LLLSIARKGLKLNEELNLGFYVTPDKNIEPVSKVKIESDEMWQEVLSNAKEKEELFVLVCEENFLEYSKNEDFKQIDKLKSS
jgi:hypothetical protein